MWVYLLPKQPWLWTRLLRAWTSWKLKNPGIEVTQPPGVTRSAASLSSLGNSSFLLLECGLVCAVQRGQSLILISVLCSCLCIPEAACCLCSQGTVHTTGASRSLIRVLQVSGQTPAVLLPLGADLWVRCSSLSLSVQPASYLSGLVELQSLPFLDHLSKYCVNS